MKVYRYLGGETWEVWDGPHRIAVVKFPGGRIVCVSHGEDCHHSRAARASTWPQPTPSQGSTASNGN